MSVFLVMPNQLFEQRVHVQNSQKIYIVEHPNYFCKYTFHYLKLLHQLCTMRHYEKYLKSLGKNVKYISLKDYGEFIKKIGKKQDITMYDPIDKDITQEYKKFVKMLDSPQFIETHEDIQEFLNQTGSQASFKNSSWYIYIRKKRGVLMDKYSKPLGNQYSFDKYNRDSFESNIEDLESELQYNYDNSKDPIVLECVQYLQELIQQKQVQTFGIQDYKNLVLPINFKQSKKWLQNFIDNKLQNFGKYQDSINLNINYGYHSFLSPLLNNGLLTPEYVITEVLKCLRNNLSNLYSIEGFVRQIIGWRSFMRILYQYEYQNIKNSNYLKNNIKIPKQWLTNDMKTNIGFVDQTIDKLKKTGYLHHIERLTIMGNYMLFCQIHPMDVLKWFMMFIDSYEWVMFGNVNCLSQYANNQFSFKCYICSTNYLSNQSNGQIKHERYGIWNSLYYNFINDKSKYLVQNYYQVNNWNMKKSSEKKLYVQIAREYLKDI